MKNEYIYIVIGQANDDNHDYDDTQEWDVIAYRDEERAKLHAFLAEAIWNAVDSPKELPKGFNKYDPAMPCYYQNVRYVVHKIPTGDHMENDNEIN